MVLLHQSVPEIQSYVFIKMYSPVTVITCVALDCKEKTRGDWVGFFRVHVFYLSSVLVYFLNRIINAIISSSLISITSGLYSRSIVTTKKAKALIPGGLITLQPSIWVWIPCKVIYSNVGVNNSCQLLIPRHDTTVTGCMHAESVSKKQISLLPSFPSSSDFVFLFILF